MNSFRFRDIDWVLYGSIFFLLSFSLVLLIASYFQPTIRGTKSWITIGGFQFEPVELMKFALILILAGFFSKRYLAAWQGKNILFSFLLAAVPGVLVLAHPDIGSAAVIFMIWVGFLLMSGIHLRRFLLGLALAAVAAALLW